MMAVSETGPGVVLDETVAAFAAKWWAVAIRAVLAIALAAIAFLAPSVTMLSLVFAFAIYAFADGLFALWAAFPAARAHLGWGLLVLEGVVDILAGAAALLWPVLTVVIFVFMVGAWAIVSGALMLGAGLRMHVAHGRWWLLLAGLASVVYGATLFLAPMIGAIVLSWWIGVYAFVFGIALLILAIRLRGLQVKRTA